MKSVSDRRFATRTTTSRVLLSLGIAAGFCLMSLQTASAQHAGHHGHAAHGAKAKPSAKTRGAARMHQGGHGVSPSDTPAVAEYKAAHDRMMRAMDLPYSGDPDVDFRTHMIPHHAGAIDMARVAMRHAKDPWTRQLAESVIYEQQREIAEMQGWLSRRGVAAPQSGQPYHVWTQGFVRSDITLPGTQSELAGKSWAPGTGVPSK